MTKTIVVASQNPVKVGATKRAFEQVFPSVKSSFVGIDAYSQVSAQPITEAETLLGAQNRVMHAREVQPKAQYWVGIEGGVDFWDEKAFAFAWIVVSNGIFESKSRSASFLLPEHVTQRLKEGEELGHAMDAILEKTNIKQQEGAVGVLSANLVTRTDLYIQPIILALMPYSSEFYR